MRRHLLTLWSCSLLVSCLAACAPSLNWRELTLAGPGLRFGMPCRPDHHERSLQVAGATVAMELHVCEVNGTLFAVSAADMKDPAKVDAALHDLRDSALGKLRGEPVADTKAPAWPGMTPQPGAGRWTWTGPWPDGQRKQVLLRLAARGTWVVQAMVLGPEGENTVSAWAPFEEALRFQP